MNNTEKSIIILIDDNEIINSSNRKILNYIINEYNLDYDILLGADGLDMIKIALNLDKRYELIKCIFTDENMDYFNGSEAISFIRKYEKMRNFEKTKIITLTCHEDVKIQETILNAGSDLILTKPVTKNNFLFGLASVGLLVPMKVFKK